MIFRGTVIFLHRQIPLHALPSLPITQGNDCFTKRSLYKTGYLTAQLEKAARKAFTALQFYEPTPISAKSGCHRRNATEVYHDRKIGAWQRQSLVSTKRSYFN
jgi:hypothetical protein